MTKAKKSFTSIYDFLQQTNDMTPEQVGSEIYWLSTEEIKAILSSKEKKEEKIEDTNNQLNEKISTDIQKYLLQSNHERVKKLKSTGMLDIEWGEISTDLTDQEKLTIPQLQTKDIKVIDKAKKTLNGETYMIYVVDIKGIKYTAIQIPDHIKQRKYQETHIGKQLVAFKDNDWYPAFLKDKEDKKLENINNKQRIVWQSDQAKNIDGSAQVNIEAKNPTKDNDILRACAKKGMWMIGIYDTIVLGELIKETFGETYMDKSFTENTFDKDKLKEIEKEFKLKLDNTTSDEYLIRDYSIYRRVKPYKKDNKDEYNAGFLRGGYFRSVRGAIGGVCSLRLSWDLGRTFSFGGFRSWV